MTPEQNHFAEDLGISTRMETCHGRSLSEEAYERAFSTGNVDGSFFLTPHPCLLRGHRREANCAIVLFSLSSRSRIKGETSAERGAPAIPLLWTIGFMRGSLWIWLRRESDVADSIEWTLSTKTIRAKRVFQDFMITFVKRQVGWSNHFLGPANTKERSREKWQFLWEFRQKK